MSGQAAYLPVPIYDADSEPISKEHPMARYEVRLDGTLVDFFADSAEAESLADWEAEQQEIPRERFSVVEVIDANADPLVPEDDGA